MWTLKRFHSVDFGKHFIFEIYTKFPTRLWSFCVFGVFCNLWWVFSYFDWTINHLCRSAQDTTATKKGKPSVKGTYLPATFSVIIIIIMITILITTTTKTTTTKTITIIIIMIIIVVIYFLHVFRQCHLGASRVKIQIWNPSTNCLGIWFCIAPWCRQSMFWSNVQTAK